MNPNYVLVASRAGHICEYCHAPEAVFNLPFEVVHIVPVSQRGGKSENNLALSCRSCNLYKSDSVSAFDEMSEQKVRFFNPRQDVWSEHFSIDENTGEIKALTPIGRVTILSLRINSKAQLVARIQWLKLKLF
ncbi:MAG: HNH endonuclease [Acidobacteriota bacterium]|nr:HNH endonuclease [Acidobacteriota bacterium]